jgi:hypothetical protein
MNRTPTLCLTAMLPIALLAGCTPLRSNRNLRRPTVVVSLSENIPAADRQLLIETLGESYQVSGQGAGTKSAPSQVVASLPPLERGLAELTEAMEALDAYLASAAAEKRISKVKLEGLTAEVGRLIGEHEESVALLKERVGALGLAGSSLEVTLPDLGAEFTPEDYASALVDLHDVIVDVRSKEGVQLATNDRVNAGFIYSASGGGAGGRASIELFVKNKGARLFIDEPEVPGVSHNPDGSIILDSFGKVETKLPFSFIREHTYIFYRSVHNGITSYHYYDLDSETDHVAGGVSTDADWESFREKKGS